MTGSYFMFASRGLPKIKFDIKGDSNDDDNDDSNDDDKRMAGIEGEGFPQPEDIIHALGSVAPLYCC